MDEVTKSGLLDLLDHAMADGWNHRRACGVLELKRSGAWRWRDRRTVNRLVDSKPGGHPVHGLLDEEKDEIVALFEQWADTDRSQRKIAHRASYLGRIWVSSSTVKRVLAAQGLHLRNPEPAGKGERGPFPEWAGYTKNSISVFDATHFRRCRTASATAMMDLVTRKWLATIVSAEQTSTQVKVAFTQVLQDEGLLEQIGNRADSWLDSSTEGLVPVLLAVSDNGL
ncbi:MAG: hypothetical protein WD602_02730 [Actinomycetota bacterium]